MYRNFIDGEWVESDDTLLNINPSDTRDVIGAYACADRKTAGRAVQAATTAFAGWATSNIQTRAAALDFIGSELLARQEELGRLLSREEGKTLAEGVAEIGRAGQIFKFFSGEALRLKGEQIPSLRPGIDITITREPIGVVGVITPWNFPIAIPAWKIAPALAYGNCVVFKPAELVPGCAWALAEIISRSGLPPGVFNLVIGPGREVGQALLEDANVDAVTFTGSTAVGQQVAATAGVRFAKLQLEMGGKNPLVVLNDANLDTAVNIAIQSAYFSTGQRCTAASRFIVEKGIYNDFVQAVAEGLKTLKVGHALCEETDIGPVVDESQLAQNLDYVQIGLDEGARLVTGGERLNCPTPGFFMEPALFADCSPDMRIAREEIFGPVACTIAADNYEHALQLANDTEYGLSAGICTSSLKYATHFQRASKAGMVMVNTPTAGVDFHVPFGGRKRSSYGPREQGSYAAEFFTVVKTAYVNPL